MIQFPACSESCLTRYHNLGILSELPLRVDRALHLGHLLRQDQEQFDLQLRRRLLRERPPEQRHDQLGVEARGPRGLAQQGGQHDRLGRRRAPLAAAGAVLHEHVRHLSLEEVRQAREAEGGREALQEGPGRPLQFRVLGEGEDRDAGSEHGRLGAVDVLLADGGEGATAAQHLSQVVVLKHGGG